MEQVLVKPVQYRNIEYIQPRFLKAAAAFNIPIY
ncbi:hypothetical protein V6Z11_A10G092700 [Gossypium hirsutum]